MRGVCGELRNGWEAGRKGRGKVEWAAPERCMGCWEVLKRGAVSAGDS